MRFLWMMAMAIAFLGCHRVEGQGLELAEKLYDSFQEYREGSVTDRRVRHAEIVPLIESLGAPFSVQVAGQSVEGRDIYRITLGNGATTVLLWSQMHGNEATATMALLDLFNFFKASGDGFDDLRAQILDQLTIVVLPMLNPDGAERFQRRNALGIDLNRDAMRLQSPEAKLLKRVRDELDADWGFNLHDMNRYYAAGSNNKYASVAFLAPAYNYQRSINSNRSAAMKLIVRLNRILQQYIPGQVARYGDGFEPRAFGDNIQKWGTRTILIESGGLEDDLEKQELRRLHFVLFVSAFKSIADGTWASERQSHYERIPRNASDEYHDILIKGATVERYGEPYTLDLAIRRKEADIGDGREVYYKGQLVDVGDLSIYHGYKEIDADGYQLIEGQVYSEGFGQIDDLIRRDPIELLRQGYTAFRLDAMPANESFRLMPLQLVAPRQLVDNSPRIYTYPAFYLAREGSLEYLVINGFLYDLDKDEDLLRERLDSMHRDE